MIRNFHIKYTFSWIFNWNCNWNVSGTDFTRCVTCQHVLLHVICTILLLFILSFSFFFDLDNTQVVLPSSGDNIAQLTKHAHFFAFDIIFAHLKEKLESIHDLEVSQIGQFPLKVNFPCKSKWSNFSQLNFFI